MDALLLPLIWTPMQLASTALSGCGVEKVASPQAAQTHCLDYSPERIRSRWEEIFSQL